MPCDHQSARNLCLIAGLIAPVRSAGKAPHVYPTTPAMHAAEAITSIRIMILLHKAASETLGYDPH